MMLFSEVYGLYFRTVAAILRERIETGAMSRERIDAIVRENAFSESVLTIGPALAGEEWLVLNRAMDTPMRRAPVAPVTLLERRWMKTILLDPRARLFGVDDEGLQDAEPLFDPRDIVCFDRCADGDPYDDPAYAAVFRAALDALSQKRALRVRYRAGNGRAFSCACMPRKMEYSERDDKFRLIATLSGARPRVVTFNLARVVACETGEPFSDADRDAAPATPAASVSMTLYDERNALERVLLHFADCRRETARTDENTYAVTLWYDPSDETEMLIRILSFGPMLRVTDPPRFVALARERILRQNIGKHP